MHPIFAKALAICALALSSSSIWAQTFQFPGNRIQKHADGALSLMAFTVVPDLTSSFLSIGSGSGTAAKTDLSITQVAGGATVSKTLPLYLEGGAAYMRYDPTFVASNGTETREIPAKWNTVSGTAGIGWDFPLMENLVFRPIFNFSLGQVASDLSVGARYLSWRTDRDLDFLDNGKMNAYGLGGSVMLDYELSKPEHDIDLELRYTNIALRSFGNTSESVKGSASAEAASIYARYRAPTGISFLDRPLRYVLEAANTVYLGDQRGILGMDYMSSVGVGLEIDSSAYDVFVTRTRIVARYAFGENVTGFAVGLAASF